MHTRQIGSLTVSAIGLGAMNMSFGYGKAESDAASARLLNRALDVGYTFIDTAMMYGSGHNETLIGGALEGRRDAYVLATKCGLSADGIDGDPKRIAGDCDASLARLRTDVIDLYYLHRADPNVPVEETIGAMARLVEAGKVRELGISECSSDTLRRAHATHSLAALQSEYSLWSRTPERKIMAACQELGITIVPFSPLGRSFLTGVTQDVSQLPPEDLRCTIARPRFEPDAFAHNIKLMEPFGAIAERVGCSKPQLALAWLLARQDRTMVPIPGTKDIAHMEENAGAGDIKLDDATVTELDGLINEKTIVGTRYTAARMASTDSERD
ncbi:MAG: aldo/keto reductase [Pseudomonadota bacterium]